MQTNGLNTIKTDIMQALLKEYHGLDGALKDGKLVFENANTKV